MKTTLRHLFWATIYALAITSPAWAQALMARAEPASNFAPEVIAYTAQHSTAICHNLDAEPTFNGVQDVALQIFTRSKLTLEQSAEVIGLSVRTRCIQHAPLMAQFAATYATPKGVIIG